MTILRAKSHAENATIINYTRLGSIGVKAINITH
jgi:hypothetical protein